VAATEIGARGYVVKAISGPELCEAIQERRRLTVELLYGDHEGGQRVVSRFGLSSTRDGSVWLASVGRHWNLDRPDPR
jgi:DNA-binding NarL/FixJ family response regulator